MSPLAFLLTTRDGVASSSVGDFVRGGTMPTLLRAACFSASTSCLVGTSLVSLEVSRADVWWGSLLLCSQLAVGSLDPGLVGDP